MGLFSSIGGLLGLGGSSTKVTTNQASTTNVTSEIDIANVIDTTPLAEASKAQAEATLWAAAIGIQAQKETAQLQDQRIEKITKTVAAWLMVIVAVWALSMFRSKK